VRKKHVRSLVLVGATPWYCVVALQDVKAEQTRSLVLVDATVSYSSAVH
jgi:hypothetical protein